MEVNVVTKVFFKGFFHCNANGLSRYLIYFLSSSCRNMGVRRGEASWAFPLVIWVQEPKISRNLEVSSLIAIDLIPAMTVTNHSSGGMQ